MGKKVSIVSSVVLEKKFKVYQMEFVVESVQAADAKSAFLMLSFDGIVLPSLIEESAALSDVGERLFHPID